MTRDHVYRPRISHLETARRYVFVVRFCWSVLVTLGHHENTYSLSLPLVNVPHHGQLARWKSRWSFTSSASSVFFVHDLCCDKYIELTYVSIEAACRFSWLSLDDDENCLEFVTFWSNRWLKTQVTSLIRSRGREERQFAARVAPPDNTAEPRYFGLDYSKSPLFQSQAKSPLFDRHLMLIRVFRRPAISNLFSCPVELQNSEVWRYIFPK